MKRLGVLDSVRGVAIVAVVAVHTTGAIAPVVTAAGGTPRETVLGEMTAYGRFGVYLFFALSGWLIFTLYDRTAPFRPAAYWARRIARIWPLWLVFLALSLVLRGVWDPTGSGPFSWLVIGDWPLLAQFLVGALFLGWLYAPLASTPPGGWSIQAEMGHYLVFPFVRRHGARLLVLSVVIAQVSYVVARVMAVSAAGTFLGALGDAWMALGLYGTWPFFVLGGVLALAWRAREGGTLSGEITRLLGDRVLVALVVLVIFLALSTPVLMGTYPEALGATLLLAIIAVALHQIGPISRPLQSLGRTSYFIYYAHFFVLAVIAWILSRITVPFLASPYVAWSVVFIGGLTVTWLLALVSWRTFERPIIRLAQRVR
jgi:peptidoglycan/LPS O-acetylase OafA/YrhL